MAQLPPPERLRALSALQSRFVEAFLETKNATAAAIKAGYAEKNAKGAGYKLLRRNKSVQAAVKEREQQLRERNDVTIDTMINQLDEDRQFAVKTNNATAAVRASEIKAKLTGLLIDRIDQRSVGQLKVEVVRYSDGEA
jgi:phage terminase small subunit